VIATDPPLLFAGEEYDRSSQNATLVPLGKFLYVARILLNVVNPAQIILVAETAAST
jgi:hypothetical protein